MNQTLKRLAVGAALGIVTPVAAFVGAPSAWAGTVTTPYSCAVGDLPPVADQPAITVNAPASAARGMTATIEASVATGSVAPVDLPPNSVNGTLTIALGSAGSGTITITGLSNPNGTPAGSKLTLVGGSAEVTFGNTGEVTFTPTASTTSFPGSPHPVACTPTGAVPVAATTTVTAG
jgi:hypothetical protein